MIFSETSEDDTVLPLKIFLNLTGTNQGKSRIKRERPSAETFKSPNIGLRAIISLVDDCHAQPFLLPHRKAAHIAFSYIYAVDIPNHLSFVNARSTYHQTNVLSSYFTDSTIHKPSTGKPKGTMAPPPQYQLTNSPPRSARRRSPADGRGMLQKRAAPFILDDIALPAMRRTQEEKNDAKYSSCHTGPDLADEGDGIKISKSATIRYQPEPLTKEELDFSFYRSISRPMTATPALPRAIPHAHHSLSIPCL